MTDDATPAGGAPPADAVSEAVFDRADPPLYAVTLWPHQSMTRSGFRWFMGALAAGLSIPLVAAWGTPVAWALAPFLLGALGLMWGMLRLNQRRWRVREELRLWPDAIAVERHDPGGGRRRWAANPYWVRLGLADTPQIARYLTLRGGGRTIELGAFLTPQERVALHDALSAALAAAVTAAARSDGRGG